eukprot:scaffold27701_cov101-Isochrysis_galbana.AAC.3
MGHRGQLGPRETRGCAQCEPRHYGVARLRSVYRSRACDARASAWRFGVPIDVHRTGYAGLLISMRGGPFGTDATVVRATGERDSGCREARAV